MDQTGESAFHVGKASLLHLTSESRTVSSSPSQMHTENSHRILWVSIAVSVKSWAADCQGQEPWSGIA